MSLPRTIEFSVSFLVAFLVIATLSFLSLRPSLTEFRSALESEWVEFLHQVRERNRLLPGLIESVRGFESGHGKLTAGLLEARAISTRSADPEKIVAAVDEIERGLAEVDKLLRSRPEMERYPPFTGHWRRVVRQTHRIDLVRRGYNKSASAYNCLLTPFPQSLLAPIFGFVPLKEYPPVQLIAGY